MNGAVAPVILETKSCKEHFHIHEEAWPFPGAASIGCTPRRVCQSSPTFGGLGGCVPRLKRLQEDSLISAKTFYPDQT